MGDLLYTLVAGEPTSPSIQWRGGARAVTSAPDNLSSWLLQAGRARRKKEATCDLDHHSPADPRRLRRGWPQDRGPHVARQAGGGIARPAMEGHGWRIAFQGRDRWGHMGATSGPRTTRSQRTTTVTSGSASSQLTGQTWPSAAGCHRRSALSRAEEARDSNPLTSTPPLLTSGNVGRLGPPSPGHRRTADGERPLPTVRVLEPAPR